MNDEEMEKLVRRAANIVAQAFDLGVFNYRDASNSPLVAAVFSALVTEETPAWKA